MQPICTATKKAKKNWHTPTFHKCESMPIDDMKNFTYE